MVETADHFIDLQLLVVEVEHRRLELDQWPALDLPTPNPAVLVQWKPAVGQSVAHPYIVIEPPTTLTSETARNLTTEAMGALRFFLMKSPRMSKCPKPNWAKIEQAAKDAAVKLGATETQTMKNQPGNHDVGFYGPTGLFIKVSYGGNLVVAGYTGCRLPRDPQPGP